MLRRLAIFLLLATCTPLPAQSLSRLQQEPAGKTIVVFTHDPGGSIVDRCKLISVDPSTLTCVDVDTTQGRLVYPIPQLDAVYEIHKRRELHLGAWLLAASIVGFIIASAVTGSIAGYVVALVIGCAAAGASPRPHPSYSPYPPAPAPWHADESGKLIYLRTFSGAR